MKKLTCKRKPNYLTLSFLLVSGLLAGCSNNPEEKQELISEQKKMEEYLETKYNQDFVVNQPEFWQESLGAPKEIKAEAYPKGEKGDKFLIKSYNGETTVFSEDYLNVHWAQQFKGEADALLSQVHGEPLIFDVRVDVPQSVYKQVDKKISLEKALSLFGKDINVVINYAAFNNFESEEEKQLLAEQTFQVISFFKTNNIQSHAVLVKSYSPELKKEVYADPEKYLVLSGAVELYNLKKQNILKVDTVFKEDVTNQIQTPADVLKYMNNL